MAHPPIPFNRPGFLGHEMAYIAQAIDAAHTCSDGPFTKRSEKAIQELIGAPRALLTTSCTHALEMAAILLELGQGDEVIVPSFTFVSTANAFALRGARPVFADVRPETLNLDDRLLPDLLTQRTRAIVTVHYAGVGCEMDRVLEIASRNGVAVVEDNAHGFAARWRGRRLGSLGALATQSFHETKNITCGEGGALVINDAQLAARAEILRDKGTNRSAFFRGEVDKYTWVDLGSSWGPSEILAAMLLAQIESLDRIQGLRRRIWDRYHARLSSWAVRAGVTLPHVPEHCEQAYHMFYMLMPSLEARTAFIGRLRRHGIHAVFHYVPLHLSPMGRRYGGRPGACPVTEDIARRLVRLPFYTGMSEEDQERVITVVCEEV